MTTPKVTILIPVFNVKTYLRECIDSILGQTLQDFEIICGDGGSNDGSLEILNEYAAKDSRISVISKEGSGYGQSMNDCMDVAKGEYISIVESDDAIKPTMLETMYRIASQNDLDWIRGDIYFYHSEQPKEKQLERESIIYGGDFYNQVLNPQEDYRPFYSGLRTWSGIYKRSFLNRHDIRHHETPGGSFQDVGFYLKTLYYAKRVYFVDQAFYMWRQDNANSSIHYNSKKLVDKSLTEWHLNKEYLDAHPELGLRARASYHYRKFFSYLWTLDMAQGEDKAYVQKIFEDEFTEAMEKGELDPGFFGEGDWARVLSYVRKSEPVSAATPVQQASVQPRGLKGLIKRCLHPFANLCRKITYKLNRNMLFQLEADLHGIEVRQKEALQKVTEQQQKILDRVEASQEQVEQIQSDLKSQSDEIKLVNSRLDQIIEKISCVQELSEQSEARDTIHSETLLSAKSRLEDIHTRVEETGQKIHDQGDVLWSAKSRLEDIHARVEETEQKIHDQGDVLWSAKSRLEDIHARTEETGQKVLDQGDILWATRDRVEDVLNITRIANDDQLWLLFSSFQKEKMVSLAKQSDIYDSMFYLKNQYASICSAQQIFVKLYPVIPHESVVDFGCGTGTWLWVAKACGTKKVLGLDGPYVPKPLLLIEDSEFRACDLERKVDLDKKYALAMSLEVAEHLSEESADVFVESICNSADVVLFSAAHPGQGGDHHVNEQPAAYWVKKFAKHQYQMIEIRSFFENNKKILPWYRENIMLFVKMGVEINLSRLAKEE